jgi:hypothetical protein
LDRKINDLHEQGFVPIIEVARRDTGQACKKYYSWPDSYARYIEYVWSRYQANNTILSPIHFDINEDTIFASDYNAPVQWVMTEFGPPPYSQLLTANSNPSNLLNFGEDSWITLHQMGNEREHDWYWYLTEIFHSRHPKPSFNGEPYYAGYKDVFGLGNGGYQYGAEGGPAIALAVSRRTPVSCSMRRKGHPRCPNAMTCCRLSWLKTLLMPTKGTVPYAGINVPGLIGRFSGDPHWPVLSDR